jgi:DNA-binding NtrC family response regulator
MKGKIFVLDDQESVLEFLGIMLEKEGYEVKTFTGGKEALDAAVKETPELALVDLKMPEMNGLDFLSHLKAVNPNIHVVIMTAYATLESAVEAMRRGAFDYIVKPFKLDEIRLVVSKALDDRRIRLENKALKQQIKMYFGFNGIVGKDRKFLKVLETVKTVASTNSTVLIYGESGTGKELVANAIHSLSSRADQPLVAVNCGALPEELLESELFGYKKGAFTGALKNKDGLFKAADGGTLFLDEIAELSPKLQVKLLRAIQEKEYTPLGDTQPESVDTRFITSTNARLEDLVKEGRFREDLYYRLNVIQISIPPLRERKSDIPLLVEHFLKRFTESNGMESKRIDPKALDVLIAHDWPGNVRELENVVERALIFTKGDCITPEDLTLHDGLRGGDGSDVLDSSESLSLEDLEKRYILKVLRDNGWNKTKTAQILGIDSSTLYRKINRYELKKS